MPFQPRQSFLSLTAGLLAITVILVILNYWNNFSSSPNPIAGKELYLADKDQQTIATLTTTETLTASEPEPLQEYLPSEKNKNSEVTSEIRPYTADSILDALQKVNLDQQGNLVIDHSALLALRSTMGHKALKLNTLQLAELQELIEIGLPGQAGQQVAFIAGKYYNYSQAKREYLQLNHDSILAEDFPQMQQQLNRLRMIHLGETLSQLLFSRSDAESTYLYERFQLAKAGHLNTVETQQQKLEVNQRLKVGLAASLGLKEKYLNYIKEQRHQLSVNNRIDNQQWHELWQEYFSGAEQQALQSLDIHPYPSTQ